MKHFFVIIALTAFTFALLAEESIHVVQAHDALKIAREWKKPNDLQIDQIINEANLQPDSIYDELSWKELYNYVNYLHYKNIRLEQQIKKILPGAKKKPCTIHSLAEAEEIGKGWVSTNLEIEKKQKEMYPWDTERIKNWKKKEIYNYLTYLHYTNIQLQREYNIKIEMIETPKIDWKSILIGFLLIPWLLLILTIIATVVLVIKGKKVILSSTKDKTEESLCCPYCGTPRSSDETQCQNCKTWFGPFQNR